MKLGKKKKPKTKTMMHPHNLSHLTLRICISRGVRHTSQRSATSPSPFIIILLEFFLKSKILHRSFLLSWKKKKNRFQPYEPLRFYSQAQPFALIALFFRFSSMFDGYAVFLTCYVLLSFHHQHRHER